MSSERQAFNDGFDKGFCKSLDKIAQLEEKQAPLLAVARAAKRIVDSDRWRGLMHIDDLEAALKEAEHLL